MSKNRLFAVAVLAALLPAGGALGVAQDAADMSSPYKPDPAAFQEGVAAYDAGNFAVAFDIWLPMAQRGDLGAMRNVGHMLRRGLGTDQDLPRALYFYKRAAERGLAGAQANYALMLLQGEGTDPDPKEAARWFYAAARRGHVLSTYELAHLLETGTGVTQSAEMAQLLYARAAEAGYRPAAERLAALGVAPENAEAVENGVSSSGGWRLPEDEANDGIETAALGQQVPPMPDPKPETRGKPAELPPPPLRGALSIGRVDLTMPVDETAASPEGFAKGDGAP